jgi:hypothetical protein
VRRSLVLAAFLVVSVVGCGSESKDAGPPPPPPPTLPATALPDLDSRSRTLDVEALAEDALERDELADLLSEAGFENGSEREFSGRTKTFDHVIARSLRFDSEDGADSYLGWLGKHGDDILGAADPAQVTPLGESSVAYTLARCGTCKKELPTFLAGWRRGAVVLTLLAAGSGGNVDRFDALARELDAVLG